MKVAGEEVLEIWPIFPNLIPQLLCVSYAGMFYMTITVDDKVVIQVWFHTALTSAAQSSSVGLIPTFACAVCAAGDARHVVFGRAKAAGFSGWRRVVLNLRGAHQKACQKGLIRMATSSAAQGYVHEYDKVALGRFQMQLHSTLPSPHQGKVPRESIRMRR